MALVGVGRDLTTPVKPSSLYDGKTDSKSGPTSSSNRSLTSFAPFVTPRRAVIPPQPRSSRSVSLDGNEVLDAQIEGRRESVDQKSRDILDEITASGRDGSPLFVDKDVQFYRQHPVMLEKADHATLQHLTKRHVSTQLLRTLGRDLAQKDAELADMRRRLEEISTLFKDHLTSVHALSRVEADKTLHNMTSQLYNREDLYSSISSAVTSPIDMPIKLPEVDQHDDAETVAKSNGPTTPKPVRPLRTVKSVLSIFGGRGTPTKDKAKATPVPNIPPVPDFAKALSERTRGSSIGSASLLTTKSEPGPVELNAIIESDELPPPLRTARDIAANYPDHAADAYGFIIDAARVQEYAHHKDNVAVADPAVAQSAVADGDNSWTSYLHLQSSALGSLSWLPVASLQPTAPNAHMDADANANANLPLMNHKDAVVQLQKHINRDFSTLQRDRIVLWERHLSRQLQIRGDHITKAHGGRIVNEQLRARAMSDAPLPGKATKADHNERARLVLGGTPMQLRSTVWSQYVNEFMMHDPDEYKSLSKQVTSIDETVLAEIEDDVPRTLANNVFFRAGKGQPALSELLRIYTVKNPQIGYCQGMNLIAGYLLLALPDTETAFWTFCYMIEYILAETYFDATLRGASIEIAVLRSYIRDLLPTLARHMEDLDIADAETVPYNWFLTAFASTLPIETLYRVWDVVLGLPTQTNFLLRVAIVLLKANEVKLLSFDNAFELRDYMDRQIGGAGIAVDGLIKASAKLGGVVKEEEVRKRRKHFAFKVDEPIR